MNRIEGLFTGGITILEPQGQTTGIFKHAATAPVHLTRTGLVGDVQADLRVHGVTGWYYRVLEEGTVAPGDIFEQLERPAPGIRIPSYPNFNHQLA